MFDINFTSYLYIFKKIRWCRQIAELGDLCSPNIGDIGPAFISTTVRYSNRYRADSVPISGRRRPDGFLLSELLNDFESKKEIWVLKTTYMIKNILIRLICMTKNTLQYILRICSALINFYSISFIHIYFFNILRIM